MPYLSRYPTDSDSIWVKSHLSCRDAHRDPLDGMDLLLELLVDLSELVDLQYV